MKKDIEIPEIDGIHIVAIKEWDKDFTEKQWNVYIVNNRKEVISTVLVLSRGKSEDRKTSTLRHSLGDIEPNMSAKIEFITTEVLEFTNRSEEHTSELQSRPHLVCRLLLEKKKKKKK